MMATIFEWLFGPRPVQTSLPRASYKLLGVSEAAKGEVSVSVVRTDDVEKHEDDWAKFRQAYLEMPIVAGAVNKTVDAVVGTDFYVDCKDDAKEETLAEWLNAVNFDLILRAIVRDMLIYGNAFVELVKDRAGSIVELKSLNPENMFVKRDTFGQITGYRQKVNNKSIDFEKGEVTFFIYNKIADKAYGTSIIKPLIVSLNNKIKLEKSMIKLAERKANAPLHVILGDREKGIQPTNDDVDSFKSDLYTLKDTTEWVSGPYVQITALDVASKILDFRPFNEHFENQLIYGLEVPMVLLGRANIPEGLAVAQADAFMKRVESIRLTVENTIEKDIFIHIIGPEVKARFVWVARSDEEKWNDVKNMTEVLKLVMVGGIGEGTRFEIEKKLAQTLEIEEPSEAVMKPQPTIQPFGQPQKKPEEKPEMPAELEEPEKEVIVSGEHIKESQALEMANLTIQEWTGMPFLEYVPMVVSFLQGYDFGQITGVDQLQIEIIRGALRTGYENDWKISQVADEINKKAFNGEDLAKATAIAKSESSRILNKAFLSNYKSRGIEKVRWVGMGGAKLCEECSSKVGEYNIATAPEPVTDSHPLCRCRLVPII